jgi:nucleoside-diphosphate-sugar epimerase
MALFPAAARVVLTGAAGRHGRLVLSLLREEYPQLDVLATDLVPYPQCPVPFVQADLTDSAAATEVLSGAQGVLHLGAVPGPSGTPPPGVDASWSTKTGISLEKLTPVQVLTNNVASAWNVLEGSARAGVKRVVFSSTLFTMGFTHDPRTYAPPHFPINEATTPLPGESYGLSKLLGEEMASCVARASAATSKPLTVASLRFTNLVYPENEDKLPWAAPTAEKPANVLMWHYTKAHDVARAHILALQTPRLGPNPHHEAFLLSAPTTRFKEATEELLGTFYPNVPLRSGWPLHGNAGVLDSSKARLHLGWRPSTADALK